MKQKENFLIMSANTFHNNIGIDSLISLQQCIDGKIQLHITYNTEDYRCC
jgi:hypothetical protein